MGVESHRLTSVPKEAYAEPRGYGDGNVRERPAGLSHRQNYGIVRGIIVRSRSIVGNFAAALQTVVGGNITILTNLCEKTREDAFELMLQHAAQHGANAVVAMRYDATEVMHGVTEVLAYGTAVQVERAQ
jgi:uncharacterized protein YbjQ (UPF0145 family)